MSRRTRRTLLIVAAVLALVALAVFLRSKAPPEAARLLPECDGIVYQFPSYSRALSQGTEAARALRRVPAVHRRSWHRPRARSRSGGHRAAPHERPNRTKWAGSLLDGA